MCVTSRLVTSPLDRGWQVLLIALWPARASLTALTHLSILGDGGLRQWEGECRWCGPPALQSSSYSTISNTSITGLKSQTHIHVHPWPMIQMNCRWQPLSCLEHLKKAYRLPLWWISPAGRPSWLSNKGERGDCSVFTCCTPRRSNHLVALAAKINEKTWGVWVQQLELYEYSVSITEHQPRIFSNSRQRRIKINHVL